MDMAFVIDSSVGLENWQTVLEFYQTIAGSVNLDGYRFAALTYHETADIHFYLNEYRTWDGYVGGLSSIPYVTTPTSDLTRALSIARTSFFTGNFGDRPEVPNAILLLTHTQPNAGTETLPAEVAELVREGIRVLAVTVGNDVSGAILESVTSEPTNFNLYYVRDFSELDVPANSLVSRICRDQ